MLSSLKKILYFNLNHKEKRRKKNIHVAGYIKMTCFKMPDAAAERNCYGVMLYCFKQYISATGSLLITATCS